MGWKCSGCRAVMMDNCKICEYCGNIRLIESKNFNSENTNFRQSNGFIDDINNLVDPGKNYKSQENSESFRSPFFNFPTNLKYLISKSSRFNLSKLNFTFPLNPSRDGIA